MSGQSGQDPGASSNKPRRQGGRSGDPRGRSDKGVSREELLDPDRTGARVDPAAEGFNQPTAMFDKGEFLGELAELSKLPDTRAKVGAEATAPRGCRLIIVNGPDLGMEWAFKTSQIVMGRDEDCELVMSDIAVSRRHAQITLDGERFVLTDLGSGNGTYLNGVRIQSQELSPGDEITVGERTLRFVELTEAPPTAAAHPVRSGLVAEPVVGPIDPGSANFEAFELIGSPARLDSGLVPPEPQLPKNLDSDPRSILPHGLALKKVSSALGTAVFLAAFVIAGVWVYRRYFAGETPAEQQARARREFMLGVELVKMERCGDARIFFRRVLAVRPDYARAKEYLTHCDGEIAQWKILEAARESVRGGRYDEALTLLDRVNPDSTYADDAHRLGQEFAEMWARGLVEDARVKWSSGDTAVARELIADALERAPGLTEAHRLKTQMDGAEALSLPPPPPPTKAKRPAIPPRLMRALGFYEQGQIGAAIDAAEAAGGPEAVEMIERFKQVRKLLRETSTAHRAKAARDLLRLAPAALEVDKALLRGGGSIRKELERYYADGLYLKGVEAFHKKDEVEAYKILSEAIRVDPGHRLARDRLTDLEKRARDIYYEGYVLKDTDPARTKKIFERIVKMTDPSDPFHKLAAKWLRQHGG